MWFVEDSHLITAVKPAATPKCTVNLAAALFCCARIYSALRRSSAGLSPAFTKPIYIYIYIFFFKCLTYTYKQEQGNKSKVIYIKQINYTN